MSGVRTITVDPDDADSRLDRWFKRRFPEIGHGRLEKLLRTGQVRVDGRRAKSNQRLEAGQAIRVPPLGDAPAPAKQDWRSQKSHRPDSALEQRLAELVLHMDEEVLAIDKPPGLPVQGGTGSKRHIDGALDGLRFGSDQRPRLVHRLDKDTSGVLLLARTRQAARWLTQAFRHQSAEKTYWGLVLGEVRPRLGTIDLPIAKLPGKSGEKMAIDRHEGQRAITDYGIVEQLGSRAAWIAMRPRTGRTHQLRVHMMAIGTPILGDGKYGGEQAFLDADGLSRKLHLHARSIRIERPDGTFLSVTAPLPEHMARSWTFFGFEEENAADPFEDARGR